MNTTTEPTQQTRPESLRSMMKEQKEGNLVVQTEQEFDAEQQRMHKNAINERIKLFEHYYGTFASQEERHDYYMYLDCKLRTAEDKEAPVYTQIAQNLMEEIREKVKQLRAMGIDEKVIAQLTKALKPVTRLVITKDYRIFLPEMENKELQLYPLSRTVYILFLNHPEGITLKNIGDYFQEMLDIYKVICGKKYQEFRAKASIEKLCCPIDNSINEKISQIHHAFRKMLGEGNAEQFYINGKKCEPRYIPAAATFINSTEE